MSALVLFVLDSGPVFPEVVCECDDRALDGKGADKPLVKDDQHHDKLLTAIDAHAVG